MKQLIAKLELGTVSIIIAIVVQIGTFGFLLGRIEAQLNRCQQDIQILLDIHTIKATK